MNDILQRIIALLALLIILPWLLILAVFIGSVQGRVFFCSSRLGLRKNPFTLYKFTTMHFWTEEQFQIFLEHHADEYDSWKNERKLVNDPRVSRVGKFLRRFSIDELPQLWNVVKGDMNLVGPRPIAEDEAVLYGKYSDDLHSVKPGITGLWQVSGRNLVNYQRRIAMNIYYVRHRSALLDLWIIYKTLWAVIGGKGAF